MLRRVLSGWKLNYGTMGIHRALMIGARSESSTGKRSKRRGAPKSLAQELASSMLVDPSVDLDRFEGEMIRAVEMLELCQSGMHEVDEALGILEQLDARLVARADAYTGVKGMAEEDIRKLDEAWVKKSATLLHRVGELEKECKRLVGVVERNMAHNESVLELGEGTAHSFDLAPFMDFSARVASLRDLCAEHLDSAPRLNDEEDEDEDDDVDEDDDEFMDNLDKKALGNKQ